MTQYFVIKVETADSVSAKDITNLIEGERDVFAYPGEVGYIKLLSVKEVVEEKALPAVIYVEV